MTLPNELDGLVVTHIDECGDSLLITTECGKKFEFYHEQDCCEDVCIHDSVGDLQRLIGKRLVSVEMEYNDIPDDVDIQPYDSYTWTEIIFRTTKATIISRWIGESNGYYSENVDLHELTK